jgi:hypothetical protein
MNTLVVYDSQYGNTERISQAIADTLREFGQAQAVHVAQAHPMEFQGGPAHCGVPKTEVETNSGYAVLSRKCLTSTAWRPRDSLL